MQVPKRCAPVFTVSCNRVMEKLGAISEVASEIEALVRDQLPSVMRICKENKFDISDEELVSILMSTGKIGLSSRSDDYDVQVEFSAQIKHYRTVEELNDMYTAEMEVYKAWKKQADEEACIKTMNELKTKYPDIFVKCAMDSF